MEKKTQMKRKRIVGWILLLLIGGLAVFLISKTVFDGEKKENLASPIVQETPSSSSSSLKYRVSEQEKAYLKQRFDALSSINPETVAYIYAPKTKLDEPVVQTTDNATYLDKTFDGGYEPYMGTVFMDKENQKDFSHRLTWLFGHARGSQVADNRMFNDVNFYDQQDYFNEHKYVVIETPERIFYYEAMGLVIVPEETAFYRTQFEDDKDFTTQLEEIYATARTKNPNMEIKTSDRYVVLSTCREEDETIRSNLYLRQIPDDELIDFLAKEKDNLAYVATR